MTRDKIQVAPGAIFLEPSEVFDPGIIGTTLDKKRIIYDAGKITEAMVAESGCTEDEALEQLSYNTIGMLENFAA